MVHILEKSLFDSKKVTMLYHHPKNVNTKNAEAPFLKSMPKFPAL